jgi:ubiquitin-conjugating enzyme E2 J2
MATPGCIRRLQQELKRLKLETPDNMDAHPSESDMLTWIVVFDGPRDTPYSTGEYLAKIIFPKDYPFKSPDFMVITPNGRFEPNTKICLSYSSYHPETWNPAWNVLSMIQGLISFMAEESQAIATIKKSEAERKKLAEKSREFNLAQPYYKSLFPARYAKSKGLSPEETAAFLASAGVVAQDKTVAEAVENAKKAKEEQERSKAAAAATAEAQKNKEKEDAAAADARAAAALAAAHHEQVRRQREEDAVAAAIAASRAPQNSASKKKKNATASAEVIELD